MSSEASADRAEARGFVDVAVPLPLARPLTYSLPPAVPGRVEPGCRVRVRVGRRRVVGIVVAVRDRAPEDVDVRAIDEVLDLAPVLTRELLDLAAFVARYYMAPIGETLRAILPARLPSWGATRVRPTRRGTFRRPADPDDAAVVEALLERGSLSLAELRKEVSIPELGERIESLQERGLVSLERRHASGSRYHKAVELPPGHLEEQLERCGRSAQGRAVVAYLAELGRPASVQEVTAAVGCGPGVVRRLVGRRVLRSFTQIERLSLDRHLTRPRGGEPVVLTGEQRAAVERIISALQKREYGAFLLHGVTGSGKSEVYLHAVQSVLEAGRSAILLVPEISLVPVLAAEARERFGDSLAVLHSALSDGERAQEWERARAGGARVVLGPRSAVLAPVPNLGLLVVDEEHDTSFKQGHTPRYHARDLALLRASELGAVAILGSATPSLESRRNVSQGKLEPLLLSRRVGGSELPEGILVDLREEKGHVRRPGEVAFSARLLEEMEDALGAGDQIILLRNRRGYAPVLLCRACGEKLPCEDCGLPRTLHRRRHRLLCHYCGSGRPVPERCPGCGGEALEPIGAGTERVEERIAELFPQAGVELLDRDTSRRIGGAAAVIERFSAGAARILVGTQMVAKGHHFPGVALTAVLAADSYLGFPDFRAVERTYSLLTQIAGRAGRGKRPGRVVVQTYYPEHYAIRAALGHDDRTFCEAEMRFRRIFHYPPFTRMVQLVFRDRRRSRAEERVDEVARRLHQHPLAAETRVSGPAPAPLERLKGYWRYQILLRHPSAARLRRLVEDALPEKERGDVTIDVDPQDLF